MRSDELIRMFRVLHRPPVSTGSAGGACAGVGGPRDAGAAGEAAAGHQPTHTPGGLPGQPLQVGLFLFVLFLCDCFPLSLSAFFFNLFLTKLVDCST